MPTVIFWALGALLVLIPLPFGGVEEWAIFGFEAAAAALLAVYIGMVKPSSSVVRAPLFFKVLFVVFIGIAVLQVIPLPLPVLEAISPRSAEIHAGAAVGPAAWRTLSLAPNLTVYELLKYLGYAVFAFLVFRSVRTKKQAEILVFLMILAGVFQAVYGLVMLFGGSAEVFGWKNRWYQGSAFGTFVNRDHYSAFLEMVFPLAVGYLLAKANFFSLKKGISFREKILWFGQERLGKAAILILLSVVIGVGLFFSRCRSGILIFFLTVFLMAIALSAGGRGVEGERRRGQRARRVIRTVALIIIFSVLLIGIKPILERFSLEVLEAEGRPILYKNTIELIKDYPLSGTGLGTYIHSYTKYEQKYVRGITDHAHNDYLEVLAESGLVGGGCLIAAAFGALGWLFVKWGRRRDDFVRGVVLGCLAGAAAVLFHSLTDFSLRMPANAVYCVTLYALALKTVGLKERTKTLA
jgi:O-antigen ligase